jgi:arylsulfatase A-like enzyme
LGRGFITYDDYPVNLGQVLLSSSLGRWFAGNSTLRKLIGYHELLNRRSAQEVTDAFLEWERRNQGRPFFAFVNYFEAHEPYFPPGYAGSILWPGRRWTNFLHMADLPNGESAWVRNKWELSQAEIEIHAAAYRSAVSDVDEQLGRLLDELDRRGVLRNTVVVIAGDHGEQLGEHGLFEHNNSLYLPSLHVPLVILPAGEPVQQARVTRIASLRDIPATVLDLLGESQAELPGRSLARLWQSPYESAESEAEGDTAVSYLTQGYVRQEWYPVNRGSEMYSLTTRIHHYIRNGDGTEELYDWQTDPSESTDLSEQPYADSLLNRFRHTLNGLHRH